MVRKSSYLLSMTPKFDRSRDGESSLASLAIVLHVCAGNYCSRYQLMEPPCTLGGYVRGNSRSCTTQDSSDCCKEGELYPQYQCSPPVTGDTPAHMTIASFAQGGDGGDPATVATTATTRCWRPCRRDGATTAAAVRRT